MGNAGRHCLRMPYECAVAVHVSQCRSKHGGSAYNMYIGTGGAVVHNSGGGAGDIEMDSPTTPKSGRVGWHAQQQQQQQQQQTGIKGAPKTTPGNDLIVRGGAANSSMTKVVPYDEDP